MRLERVEALAGQHAPRRWPAPAARRPRRRRSSLARGAPATPRRRAGRAASRSPARSGARAAAARRRARRRSRGCGSRAPAAAGSPKIEKKTASKASTCAWSDTNTERAVQYSRRGVIGRTSVSACAKAAERSGVIGTPASCRRRLNAPASGGRSSRSSRPRTPDRRSVTAAHELLETGRADHLLVLVVLQHRPEREVHGRGVQVLDPEQARAPPASRSPRRSPAASARRCRASARPRRRPGRPASARRPSRGGARSPPRAAGVG